MGWQDAPLTNDPWAKFVPPPPNPANGTPDPWARFVPTQQQGGYGKDPEASPPQQTGGYGNDPAPAWAQAPLADASAAAPPPDKYQQAAIADRDAANQAFGRDVSSYGVSGQMLNGAMLGALPTVMAGLETPFEMIKRGTLDPGEAYSYAKASENLALADTDAQHPIAGPAANIAGGVLTGAGLANAGVTFARPAAGLIGRALGTAADGAAYGAAGGFLSGEGQDRLSGAAEGAAVGGALGGAVPLLAGAAVGNPIVSQISARLNPEGSATSQLARALSESGQTPGELQGAITDAAAAGQPNYALADALGNPGQRMLTTVTKSPGPGRTAAQQFLDARQAGQSADVSSQLADALDAHGTASGTIDALTAQRSADAATNYGAARASGGAVDVTPAIQLADQTLQPGLTGLMSPQSTSIPILSPRLSQGPRVT